jgi:tail-anchored protein insertion receptor
MVCIHGFRLFIQWFYNKTPLFWIPKGWLPFYAEWLLSFPMAPRGSISIYIWSIACGSVIKMVSDALVAGFVLAVGGNKDTTKAKVKTGLKAESKKAK